jgi:hypothetical protein
VDGTGSLAIVSTDAFYGELSGSSFPGSVPSVRVETIWRHPSGGSMVNDFHIQPGLAFLVLANLEVMVVGSSATASRPTPVASRSRGPVPIHRPGRSPPVHPGWAPILLGPNTGAMIMSRAQEFESLTIVIAFAM